MVQRDHPYIMHNRMEMVNFKHYGRIQRVNIMHLVNKDKEEITTYRSSDTQCLTMHSLCCQITTEYSWHSVALYAPRTCPFYHRHFTMPNSLPHLYIIIKFILYYYLVERLYFNYIMRQSKD